MIESELEHRFVPQIPDGCPSLPAAINSADAAAWVQRWRETQADGFTLRQWYYDMLADRAQHRTLTFTTLRDKLYARLDTPTPQPQVTPEPKLEPLAQPELESAS